MTRAELLYGFSKYAPGTELPAKVSVKSLQAMAEECGFAADLEDRVFLCRKLQLELDIEMTDIELVQLAVMARIPLR